MNRSSHIFSPRTITLAFTALAIIIGAWFATAHAFSPPQLPQWSKERSDLKKVIQPNAFFYTKTFLQRDHTFISLPFMFEAQPSVIWITLMPDEGEKNLVLLAYHPQLALLDWPMLSQAHLNLYQRHQQYTDLNDFLRQPPPSSEIIMDYQLAKLKPYQHLTTNTFEAEFDLGPYNYILTTFQPPRQADGLYYYETVFDASTAGKNILDEMVWHIYAPQINEVNTLYLGTIHVDYRQQ